MAPPADRDLIGAFQAVGDAILAETELDEVLHLVIARLCELLGIRRGSLYLRDAETELFHGQVGGASPEVDRQVKRLTCGVPADRFTHEIVSTRAPVFIADAQHDPRPVRSTMRAWRVRSMLGVPMIAGGEVQARAAIHGKAEEVAPLALAPRVPMALQVGDQRRAEMAHGLLARIGGEVAAKHVEWLLHDTECAPVADCAHRARASQGARRLPVLRRQPKGHRENRS